MWFFENGTKAERQSDMSESVVKAKGKPSLSDMPMDLQAQNEEEPTEVLLAMLYTAAKMLGKRSLATVLTGYSPATKKPVTYIRLPMIEIDELLGFRIANESIGNAPKT